MVHTDIAHTSVPLLEKINQYRIIGVALHFTESVSRLPLNSNDSLDCPSISVASGEKDSVILQDLCYVRVSYRIFLVND